MHRKYASVPRLTDAAEARWTRRGGTSSHTSASTVSSTCHLLGHVEYTGMGAALLHAAAMFPPLSAFTAAPIEGLSGAWLCPACRVDSAALADATDALRADVSITQSCSSVATLGGSVVGAHGRCDWYRVSCGEISSRGALMLGAPDLSLVGTAA